MSKRSIDIDDRSTKKIRLTKKFSETEVSRDCCDAGAFKEQNKRKSTSDILVNNIKRMKIYVPEYVCVLHDNDRDVCSVYDCDGHSDTTNIDVSSYCL